MEQIDIAKVIEDKNEVLARRMPKFFLNYLRRILHEKEINEILSLYGHLNGIPFIKGALAYMGIEFRAEGLSDIPADGRYLFASNHPFGGLDGLMLAVLVAERFGDVKVVVNDLLMNLDPLKELFLPVNKHGRQNQQSVLAFNNAFMSDIPIITFPAGLCSRRTRGVVSDMPWHTNFIRKAQQSNRDIVPVFFPGVLSGRFYRLANTRRVLGIKSNFEMIYLPDEMFRQKGRSFDIYFGKPMLFEEELALLSATEACAAVRENTYSLNPSGVKK